MSHLSGNVVVMICEMSERYQRDSVKSRYPKYGFLGGRLNWKVNHVHLDHLCSCGIASAASVPGLLNFDRENPRPLVRFQGGDGMRKLGTPLRHFPVDTQLLLPAYHIAKSYN